MLFQLKGTCLMLTNFHVYTNTGFSITISFIEKVFFLLLFPNTTDELPYKWAHVTEFALRGNEIAIDLARCLEFIRTKTEIQLVLGKNQISLETNKRKIFILSHNIRWLKYMWHYSELGQELVVTFEMHGMLLSLRTAFFNTLYSLIH